jgi:MscS family membrane protein
MKYILLFLLIFTDTITASDSFWKKLVEVEEKFFNPQNIITFIEQDSNKSMILDNNESSSALDEQFEAFASMIALLKKNPYSLDINQTDFFDPKKNNQQIRDLTLKIQTNQRYGYTLAVQRDTINLTSLELKEQIYHFFYYLAKNWTRVDKEKLQSFIEENHKKLKTTIKIEVWNELYKKVNAQSGVIPKQIEKNFLILAQDYYFFESFLSYLELNRSSLNYTSLSSQLKIDNLIGYINKEPFAQEANLYLRYVKLDMGRVILFGLVILFFLFLNYLIYRRLYFYFKSKILEEKDDNDDILLENLKKIRLPVSLFINGIGLQLALEVLDYPHALSESTNLYFSLFFIVMSAYIGMQIIENLFFIYFEHNSKKNLKLRTELINLILSVSKVIILLIALLLGLLKMDINVSGVIASLGIGGLAVALAAKDTLSNFFGLLKIIFDESFSQGDWIATSEVEGIVVEIGFISTKIRTFDNAMITVPNEKLANTSIKNWSRRKVGRRVKMYVGVTYNSNAKDIQKAIDDIHQMLVGHEGISTLEKINTHELKRDYRRKNKLVSLDNKIGIKSTLMVYLDSFSDSSIDILIYTFTKTTNWEEWLKVKQDILYRVWDILEKNNLEFAFPSQSIYLENNN